MRKSGVSRSVLAVELRTLAVAVALSAAAVGDLQAADQVITVDGLSGAVTPVAPTNVAPSDIVTVQICPADLINYEYTIEKSEQALKEGFPIVGVDTTAQATGTGGGTRDVSVTAAFSPNDEPNLLAEYQAIRGAIASERTATSAAAESVQSVARSPLGFAPGRCDSWPLSITTLAGACGKPSPFLEGDREEGYKRRVAAIEKLEQRRRALLAAIQDRELEVKLSGGTPLSVLSDLKQATTGLQSEIASMQAALEGARTIVDRWRRIIQIHCSPKLEQRYRMPLTSARIAFSVSRKPVTAVSRNEAPEGTEPAKIASAVIAVTSLENRARHRFNVSLGMTGAWREDSREYSVAPRLDEAGKVSHQIRESKQDEVLPQFAAFLGIYLSPTGIDPFSDERQNRWMAMLGTEISASPKDFFVGVGRDSRRGVVVGVGALEYESTELAGGWREGQEVPTAADNKPIIATVPTRKGDSWAPYAFLGFRPSIFRALLDRRKP